MSSILNNGISLDTTCKSISFKTRGILFRSTESRIKNVEKGPVVRYESKKAKKNAKINESDFGGAIEEKKVRFAEIEQEDVRIHIDKVLSGLPIMSAPAPALVSFVHGLTDFIPRNIQGGDQFFWKYKPRDEKELHQHLLKKTKGKGFNHEDPLIGKAISETLEKFPELQAIYHR